VLQFKGHAAVWAMHRFPMSTPIEWSTSCTELKSMGIASNALDLVKREWEELSLKTGQPVTVFNDGFRYLRSKLDPYQPVPAEMLADAYIYTIAKGSRGVSKDLIRYSGMRDRTPIPSAKNISLRAEWLRQSGRPPSELSEISRWRITPRLASIACVGFHIAIRSLFRSVFSLSRSGNFNTHSGVVAKCDHTSEWVHWLHACIGIAM